jgi:thiol-disulfide isomerase/thioredoxin
MIKDYQRLHRNITGNHSFTVSPQFLAPLSKAPLDDIDAFDNISEYRMFLSDYIAGTLQEDDTKFDYLSKKIKSIKYSRIKDFIALALSNFIAPRNTNFDKINNLAISIATDENIKREIKENYQIFSLLKPGSPSPDFSYTDINGKNVSLSDLRGNYVYIDVWATWCGPCKGQIPYLKKLVKKFKDKPIKFVSISVDRKKNYIAWKDFVKNHDMTWYQLFADNSWDSDFIKKYHIESIPHFILLDKQGKIIESDALRPSNATLENELNNLLK